MVTSPIPTERAPVRCTNIIRGIRMSLGQDRGHGVDVELSDAQIVYAIREALSLYSRYHSKQTYQTFTANLGQFEYTPNPPVKGILSLSMTPVTALGLGVPELVMYGTSMVGIGGSINYNSPYQYAVFVEWQKAANRVFSQTPCWCFVKEANRLYVYSPSKLVKVSFTGAIEWDYGFDEEEMWDEVEDPDDSGSSKPTYERLDATLKEIPINHVNWVRSLARAKSMEILGRIRSKYSSVPSTEGKDVQMDGADLLSTAKELWEKTESQMKTSAFGKLIPVYA